MGNIDFIELAKFQLLQQKYINRPLGIMDLITLTSNCFSENQLIDDAAKYLLKDRESGLPVVNNSGIIIGFLSEKDCLKKIQIEIAKNSSHNLVKDFMSREVIVFTPNTSMFNILDCFVRYPHQIYPVEDNGIYIGYIRRQDVLSLFVGD